MNKEAIGDNYKAIQTNKTLIIGLMVFALAQMSVIAYLVNKQHNLEKCSSVLYSHLTKQTDLDECSHD